PAARAAAPCPHAWMPLSRGATWTYRTGDGEKITLKVSAVDSRSGFLIATVDTLAPVPADAKVDPEGDPVLQTTFLCSDDGVDLPFPQALGAGRARIEMLSEEGPTLPPATVFKPGVSWTSTRALRVSTPDRVVRTRIESTHTYGGDEKVTVGAGTFTAARVDVSSEITSIVDGPRASSSSVAGLLLPTKTLHHLWFVKGVGLVKMTSEPPAAGSGTALPSTGLELVHVAGTRR
ncbi:MAG TPA: hypothetical protein VMV18_05940, partial [bacterium]|nr:hypothetical protein [bacterium]